MRARRYLFVSAEGGSGGFGLYCLRSLNYNWCSRLDEGLSSADYDNNAIGVNYYYRHFYPKCLDETDLKTDELIRVEKNKTLDIIECGANCNSPWPHMYFLMKARGERTCLPCVIVLFRVETASVLTRPFSTLTGITSGSGMTVRSAPPTPTPVLSQRAT